jgi:hypothetical protein
VNTLLATGTSKSHSTPVTPRFSESALAISTSFTDSPALKLHPAPIPRGRVFGPSQPELGSDTYLNQLNCGTAAY